MFSVSFLLPLVAVLLCLVLAFIRGLLQKCWKLENKKEKENQ